LPEINFLFDLPLNDSRKLFLTPKPTVMNLKKILMIAALAIPSFLFAQKDIYITETIKNMSAGNQSCYVALIPQAAASDVTDDWKKYIRKDTKAKPDENSGEIRIMGAFCKNISPFPINIYATFLETSEGVQISAWFSDGSTFISTQSNSDKSVGVQNYLHNFGVQEYKDVVKYQLGLEQKKQKDLEKVFDGFVKDQKRSESNITSYNKDIEKLQNKIAEEQQNIQKAQSNQVTSRADADNQKAKVQQVNDMLTNIK
jgi:hypothetical protein